MRPNLRIMRRLALKTAGAVLLAAALLAPIGSSLASANEVTNGSVAVIELPQGLTIEVVEFPLAPISMWLAAYSPSSDFDDVIEARCDPDGAWARYAITSGGGTLGSAGPSVPPDRSPSPAPLASLSWSACLRCVGSPA